MARPDEDQQTGHDMRTGLTHDEDGALRRMHFFETLGARLAPSVQADKRRLRAKDLRQSVREPREGRVAPTA